MRSDTATTLLDADTHAYDVAFTHDGKWAVYRTASRANDRDINYRSIAGGSDTATRPFVATSATETTPVVSPDDHWVAYASDESGRVEVYARPFPGPGARIQISAAGGQEPQWSHDGRTLFYRLGRLLIAADLSLNGGLSVNGRRQILDNATVALDGLVRGYDVSPDGKHFLMVRNVNQQVSTVVVHGWANELRRAWRK